MNHKTLSYVKKREKRVAKAIRESGSSITFSVSGHRTRQKNNIATIRRNEVKTEEIQNSVHSDFGTINDKSQSMLCVYERSRAMLISVAYLCHPLAQYLRESKPVYFGTIVQPQHYADVGKLNSVSPRRVHRKYDDAMRELKRDFPDFFSVSTLEISAYEDRNKKIQFHPHIHLILAGVPRERLNHLLVFRKLATQRPRVKTVQISRLKSEAEIAHRLLYITKFTPQLSAPYENGALYGGRSDQPMPEKYKAEWLAWMSNVHILDIFKFHNLARARINKIKVVEIQTIIKRFLRVTNSLNNKLDE